MNKAFTKESDDPTDRCPTPKGCGRPAKPVSPETLVAQLAPEDAASFNRNVWFCANPECPVAYFDAWGTVAQCDALAVVPWPKDPNGPVCGCRGVTAERIREAALAGDREFVRDILKQATAEDALCAERSATGRSCAKDLRRLFLRDFEQDG